MYLGVGTVAAAGPLISATYPTDPRESSDLSCMHASVLQFYTWSETDGNSLLSNPDDTVRESEVGFYLSASPADATHFNVRQHSFVSHRER
jgi:hypothetical protein